MRGTGGTAAAGGATGAPAACIEPARGHCRLLQHQILLSRAEAGNASTLLLYVGACCEHAETQARNKRKRRAPSSVYIKLGFALAILNISGHGYQRAGTDLPVVNSCCAGLGTGARRVWGLNFFVPVVQPAFKIKALVAPQGT